MRSVTVEVTRVIVHFATILIRITVNKRRVVFCCLYEIPTYPVVYVPILIVIDTVGTVLFRPVDPHVAANVCGVIIRCIGASEVFVKITNAGIKDSNNNIRISSLNIPRLRRLNFGKMPLLVIEIF